VSHEPHAHLASFLDRNAMPHGIAGDAHLLFLTEPLDGRVIAVDRATRAEVGTLPEPASGFVLPFQLRTPRGGRVVVLDAGGFPSPSVPAVPSLHEYDYQHTGGTFQATLVRSISFAGTGFGFAEDF
jgi:hypothetical protein